jgi:hypothetical protein
VDAYIQWTLYGVKPDVASPPLRSLQDPETDGVRMTMFYYPIVPPPAQDLTPDVEVRFPSDNRLPIDPTGSLLVDLSATHLLHCVPRPL